MHPLLSKMVSSLGKYHPLEDTPVPFTLEGWQPHGSGQVRALDSCMPKCWARHNLGHINHPVCCDWLLWLVDTRQWEFGNGRLLSAVEFPGKISDMIFFLFLMRRQLSTLEACCMNDLACCTGCSFPSYCTQICTCREVTCVSNCILCVLVVTCVQDSSMVVCMAHEQTTCKMMILVSWSHKMKFTKSCQKLPKLLRPKLAQSHNCTILCMNVSGVIKPCISNF